MHCSYLPLVDHVCILRQKYSKNIFSNAPSQITEYVNPGLETLDLTLCTRQNGHLKIEAGDSDLPDLFCAELADQSSALHQQTLRFPKRQLRGVFVGSIPLNRVNKWFAKMDGIFVVAQEKLAKGNPALHDA